MTLTTKRRATNPPPPEDYGGIVEQRPFFVEMVLIGAGLPLLVAIMAYLWSP